MSLATRCTSCGTIFRVVQDQLKVSEGWVRCGRCDAVFNASEGLFDLEREAPPAWEPPAAGAVAAPPMDADSGLRSTYPEVDAPRAAFPHEADTHDAPPSDLHGSLHDSYPRSREQAPHSSLAAIPSDATEDAPGPDEIVIAAETPAADPWRWSDQYEAPVAPTAPSDAGAAPGFVQRAQREAFWQSRRARVLLWSSALLLVAALVLQAATHFSELSAARWPASRPALAAWCGLAGCSTAPPHRIDDVVVESTALAPAPGGGALKLSVSLRNRAAYAVAIPSIDLSLTDTAGQLVSRRALSSRDFQVGATSLPANGELPLQLVFSTGSARVTGYTVEIFYP